MKARSFLKAGMCTAIVLAFFIRCSGPRERQEAAWIRQLEQSNLFLEDLNVRSVNRLKLKVASQPHGYEEYTMSGHIDSLLNPLMQQTGPVNSDSLNAGYDRCCLLVGRYLQKLRQAKHPAYFLASDTSEVNFTCDSLVYATQNPALKRALIRNNVLKNQIRLNDFLRDNIGTSVDWFILTSHLGYQLVIEKESAACYFHVKYNSPQKKPAFIPLTFKALREHGDDAPDAVADDKLRPGISGISNREDGVYFRSKPLKAGKYALELEEHTLGASGREVSDALVIYFELN